VSANIASWQQPKTEALRRALSAAADNASVNDLLFLEAWEIQGTPDIADTLRASQIRRANPQLAQDIRSELGTRRGRTISVSPQ
jgi:hypothetical protein